MKLNWEKDSDIKNRPSQVMTGGYEAMIKTRKKKLPEMQEAVQDVLKDWGGENLAIILMKEDENGLPTGSHIIMTGCARPEMQIGLAKALNKTSETAIEQLIDTAKENPEILIKVMSAIVDMVKEDNK